jgi:hypothetical protein
LSSIGSLFYLFIFLYKQSWLSIFFDCF